MCEPASFILTKDNCYWSLKTDSHEDILAEFKLRDAVAGKVQIVRLEITPPNGDFFAPADQWKYRVDQDILPSWYDAEKCEARARKALAEWIKTRVLFGGTHEVADKVVWVKDASAVLRDNASAVLRENASAVLRENARAVLWENAVAIDRSKSTMRIITSCKANHIVADSTK